MKKKLESLLAENPNMINFGRSLQARDIDMYNFVMSWHIGGAFNEKLYCLVNNITEIPVCPGTGKILKFINYHEGYPVTVGGFKLTDLTPLNEVITEEDIEYLTSKLVINNPINLKTRCKIYQKLVYHTSGLKNPTVTERIFCYMNGITATPENSRFVNYYEGYVVCGFYYDAHFLELSTKIGAPNIDDGRDIHQFLIRNKNNSAELYQLSDDQEGIEFVTCPILGARMHILKSNYITNILKMKVHDFDVMFPDFNKVSIRHIENIKNGANEFDDELGITKHQIGTLKTKETMKKIDEDGFTKYQKLGIKTRQTHMENIDEFGRNGYSQLATKAILVGNRTKMDRGIITNTDNKDKFRRYKVVVMYLTQQLKSEITEGYLTGLAGIKGAYHIDHIYSIFDGFRNNISPIVIGHKANLRMIPWEDNLVKHSRSDVTIDELYNVIGTTEEKSYEEFIKIMRIIDEDIENNITVNGGYVLERFYETKLRT